MQAQRGHLDREHGDLEVGVADVLRRQDDAHHAAPLPAPPAWLSRWEQRRPTLLVEMLAEAIGVFMYVFPGVGATVTFLVTTVAKETGFGSMQTIALCYAFGIAFAIIVAAPTSGGHLSPSFTIAFMLFKGFPARKVPFYILAQLIGGFVACLCVYGMWKQQLDEVYDGFLTLGAESLVFSPSGPAGAIALFPQTGQLLKYAFFNEFMCNLFLSLVVFSVLDATNNFVSIPGASVTIGLSYFAIIAAFAVNSVSLNAARDLGGRFACAAIYGHKCFTASSGYTALAALTTFPATLLGAGIHTLFLSDNRRMLVNYPRELHEQISIVNEQRGFTVPDRVITRDTVFRDPSPVKA
ncbi:hypothetical protein JCM10207_002879 [Rhodosporidiobolus poonsookiae]